VKPVALTLSGLVLGLTAVLPLARQAATPPQLGVQIAPVAAPPPPTNLGAPRLEPTARTVSVTGPVVATRYGPVQVRVVLTGHRLVSAVAVQLPDGDGQSRSINRAAGPALARQAVASQGTVDGISGATWTSNGYRRSLQAALDAARAAATVPVATG
jgi:hypothetical protein